LQEHSSRAYELLPTPFETVEGKNFFFFSLFFFFFCFRDQLGPCLALEDFDPVRDFKPSLLTACHTADATNTTRFRASDRPLHKNPLCPVPQTIRQDHLANSDSEGHAYTNTAIDQAIVPYNKFVSFKRGLPRTPTGTVPGVEKSTHRDLGNDLEYYRREFRTALGVTVGSSLLDSNLKFFLNQAKKKKRKIPAQRVWRARLAFAPEQDPTTIPPCADFLRGKPSGIVRSAHSLAMASNGPKREEKTFDLNAG